MQLLDGCPYGATYAAALRAVLHIKKIQVIVLRFRVNLNYSSTDHPPLTHGFVCDGDGF